MFKRNARIKRGLSWSLVAGLSLLFSSFAFAETRGADLNLLMKNGSSVEGELIAVQGSTLILRDQVSEKDVSLGLDELSQVIIKNGSKTLAAVGLGLLGGIAGGAAGVFIGRSVTPHGQGMFGGLGQAISGGVGAGIGALFGGFIGVGVGLSVTRAEKFEIGEMNASMKDALLRKLRSKSHFPQHF